MEDNTFDTDLAENVFDMAHVIMIKKKKRQVQDSAVMVIPDSWVNGDLHFIIRCSVSECTGNA